MSLKYANPNGGGGLSNIAGYSLLSNNTGSSALPVSNASLIFGTAAPYSTTAGSVGIQQTLTFAGSVQWSLQNLSANALASTDVVVTSTDGTDSSKYTNLGRNGSGGGAAPFTVAYAAYLYDIDGPEVNIGALGSAGVIKFHTTGGTTPVQAGSIGAAQQWTMSGNGAASISPLLMNGTVFTGGTGTTTLPKLLLQASSATAATGWPPAGCQIAVNSVAGFTGSWFECRINGGASVFTISGASGNMQMTGDISFSGGTQISYSASTILRNVGNGIWRLSNSAVTALSGTTRLVLGNAGATDGVAINVSTGLVVSFVLGDGTGAVPIIAGSVQTSAPTGGVSAAAAWQLGSVVTAATALDTTKYAEVYIGGTLRKVCLGA